MRARAHMDLVILLAYLTLRKEEEGIEKGNNGK
jgi:hypothetical protein